MSIAFAQMQRNWSYPASSMGQTLTFGSNCTVGSLLIAEVSAYSGTPDNTAVSDPVNGTWNYVANVVGGYGNMSVYYIVNTSATALAVSWAAASSGYLGYPSFQICEFTGTKVTSPLDNSTTNTGVTGVAVTATGANELIIGVPVPSVGGAMETTTGWTSTDPGDSVGQPMIYAVEVSSGSYTPTFTNSGGVQSLSFFPAVVVAGGVNNSLMMMGSGI